MKSKSIILSIALIAGALIAGIFYVFNKPTQSHNANALIVGVSADFPPFAFIQNNTIVGFDIDIITEIGKRLGKQLELRNMPFNTLIPSLQLGNIHVIAAGLTATPERAQQVLFTTPYLEDGPLVIVSSSKNPAQTIADLTGKEVAVNQGYTADLYISKINGPSIRRLPSPADAFMALKSGRAYAFITAENTVKPFFDQYGSTNFHVARIPGTGENSCLAISKKYPDLLPQIQQTLDDMKADGTLQQLQTKWGLA